MALGALAVPLAHAEDHKLKDRQKHVQSQIHARRHDLDESSAQMRRAAARRAGGEGRARPGARASSAPRRRSWRRGQAARPADAGEAPQAEARLEPGAGRPGAGPAGGRPTSGGEVTDTVTSIYEQGDPQLLAFSSLLDAQNPADLTRRMEANNVIVGRETRAYDEPARRRGAAAGPRGRGAAGQRRRRGPAQGRGRSTSCMMRQLVDQTHAAQADGARRRSQSAARPRRRPAGARAPEGDRAQLKRLHAQEHKIRERILAAGAARPHAPRRLPRPHRRVPDAARPGTYVTSPFGWRDAPDLPLLGPARRRRLPRRLRHRRCTPPAAARVMSEYYSSVWGNRLYLNLGSVNGKNVTVIYNHLTPLRGRHAAPTSRRGEIVGYAGTTGWSTGCHLHFTVMVNGSAGRPDGLVLTGSDHSPL